MLQSPYHRSRLSEELKEKSSQDVKEVEWERWNSEGRRGGNSVAPNTEEDASRR